MYSIFLKLYIYSIKIHLFHKYLYNEIVNEDVKLPEANVV